MIGRYVTRIIPFILNSSKFPRLPNLLLSCSVSRVSFLNIKWGWWVDNFSANESTKLLWRFCWEQMGFVVRHFFPWLLSPTISLLSSCTLLEKLRMLQMLFRDSRALQNYEGTHKILFPNGRFPFIFLDGWNSYFI